MLEWAPLPGIADSVFHCFRTDAATWEADPVDAFEAERIAWLTVPEIRAAFEAGQIGDGFAVPALLKLLAES